MRIYRRVVVDIFGGRLQQFDGLRVVCFATLGIHQDACQHNGATLAARNRGLLRQRFGLGVITLGKLDLGQERHGIDISPFCRFLCPHRCLLAVAGAEPGVGEIILSACIARLRLRFVLAANLIGMDERRNK